MSIGKIANKLDLNNIAGLFNDVVTAKNINGKM